VGIPGGVFKYDGSKFSSVGVILVFSLKYQGESGSAEYRTKERYPRERGCYDMANPLPPCELPKVGRIILASGETQIGQIIYHIPEECEEPASSPLNTSNSSSRLKRTANPPRGMQWKDSTG
jgi:hypothetical protein